MADDVYSLSDSSQIFSQRCCLIMPTHRLLNEKSWNQWKVNFHRISLQRMATVFNQSFDVNQCFFLINSFFFTLITFLAESLEIDVPRTCFLLLRFLFYIEDKSKQNAFFVKSWPKSRWREKKNSAWVVEKIFLFPQFKKDLPIS